MCGVASGSLRARMKEPSSSVAMKPRQNTSSAAANCAAPSLMQTPMLANSRLAATIQSDCIRTK